MIKTPSNLIAGSNDHLHVASAGMESVNMETRESCPHLTLQSPLAGQPAAQPLNSADLFKGAHQIMIEHGNDMYCLRLTKQGKLILTK